MSTNYMEGNWLGVFNYDETYSLSYQNKLMPFRINFRLEDGVIIGECEDDIMKQLQLKSATIEGTFEDDTIQFIKRYFCLVEVDENDNLRANPLEPSIGIQYNGKLHTKLLSGKEYIKCEWDISGSFTNKQGNIQYYTIGGYWRMEKVN